MLAYMPPEALDNRHRYGPSLDIFSFGHPGSQGRLRQESPRNCEMLGWQSSFQILAFFSSFRKACHLGKSSRHLAASVYFLGVVIMIFITGLTLKLRVKRYIECCRPFTTHNSRHAQHAMVLVHVLVHVPIVCILYSV